MHYRAKFPLKTRSYILLFSLQFLCLQMPNTQAHPFKLIQFSRPKSYNKMEQTFYLHYYWNWSQQKVLNFSPKVLRGRWKNVKEVKILCFQWRWRQKMNTDRHEQEKSYGKKLYWFSLRDIWLLYLRLFFGGKNFWNFSTLFFALSNNNMIGLWMRLQDKRKYKFTAAESRPRTMDSTFSIKIVIALHSLTNFSINFAFTSNGIGFNKNLRISCCSSTTQPYSENVYFFSE